MGMSIGMMKKELAAMHLRKEHSRKEEGIGMERKQEQQQQEQGAPRGIAITVARIGVELFALAFTVVSFVMCGVIALICADVMSHFATNAAYLAPESLHRELVIIACYGVAIYACVKDAPRMIRDMREWLFEPFRRALKNNPAQEAREV